MRLSTYKFNAPLLIIIRLLCSVRLKASPPLFDLLCSAASERRQSGHDQGAPQRRDGHCFFGDGWGGFGGEGEGVVADGVAAVAAVQREGVHGVRRQGEPRFPRRDLRWRIAEGGRAHGRRRPRPAHHPPQEAELGGRVAHLRRRRGVAIRTGAEEVHGATACQPEPDQVPRAPVAGACIVRRRRRRDRAERLPVRRGGLVRRPLPRRVRLLHRRREAAARGGGVHEGSRRGPGRVPAGGGAGVRAGASHGRRHYPRPDARVVKASPPCRCTNLKAPLNRSCVPVCHKEQKLLYFLRARETFFYASRLAKSSISHQLR